MKVAYVTELPSDDVRCWSGTPYYMARALEATFDEVVVIETPYYGHMPGSVQQRLEAIGRYASDRLRECPVDAIVCQGNSAVPCLDTSTPVTYWHDSTWAALATGHFGTVREFDLFSREDPELRRWDEMALERATFITFAADWLVEHTGATYGIAADKMHVLPYGANMDIDHDMEELAQVIVRRPLDRCHLTFLGKDWRRKGLPFAVEVVDRLNGLGLEAKLTVVGCDESDEEVPRSPHIDYRGFIDKASPEGERQIREILRSTHFLLHPAHFECFGICMVEANAFGVPVLGTPAQGLKTVVRDGENGALFPQDTYVDQAVYTIIRAFADYTGTYLDLACSSFQAYTSRLCWQVNAERLRTIFEAEAGSVSNPLAEAEDNGLCGSMEAPACQS